MKNALLSVLVLAGMIVVEAVGQQRSIPVYPGAKLETEQQENGECCDFVTTDSFEKVVAFYEKQLNTKALDTKALVAAYPALKQQIQAMEQQMPPNFKLRAFVIEELTVNGQKMPNFFEVTGSPDAVRFSIGGDALAGNDAQFAKQWREKTGKLTEEEQQQQQRDQAQADADKEQKEREARKAKEMPEYMAKMTTELSKSLKQNNASLPPGFQCENIQSYQGESSSGFAFYFVSTGDFKKAYDFYASHIKGAEITNAEGGLAGWSDYETVYFWRQAEFPFGSALRIDVKEISMTKDGPKKTYVAVFVSSPEAVKALGAISAEYQSRW